MKKFRINFTSKMGMSTRPSTNVMAETPRAAFELARDTGDYYTLSVEDKSSQTVFHFGHTGVFISANSF